jgi:hypothetical protein
MECSTAKMEMEYLTNRPLAKVELRPPIPPIPRGDPMPPPILGGEYIKVPQNWGASAVLGSPQVEHLAWI